MDGAFKLSLQDGQRRLQLMGGIGGKTVGLLETALEACQHAVEEFDQFNKFLVFPLDHNPLVKSFCGNTPGSGC